MNDMDQRPASVESRLEELSCAIRELSRRLEVLERSDSARANDSLASTARPRAEEEAPKEGGVTLVGLASPLGRFCVALGGAYLLRALAEGGTVSLGLGLGLGLAYAAALLGLAAASKQNLSAIFHALAAAAVAFPLLFEGTLRHGALPVWLASLLLSTFAAAGLAIALRRKQRAVAWLFAMGPLLAGFVLLFKTRALPVFGPEALAVTAAAVAIGDARGWAVLRWTAALLLDIAMALLWVVCAGLKGPAWLPAQSVVIAQAVFFATFLALFAARTFWLKRPLFVFEVTQTTLALLVGFEGALQLAGQHAWAPAALALGLAALCFAAALSERAPGGAVAFAYFSTLAAGLTIEGLRAALPPAPLVLAFSALAVASAALGKRAGCQCLQVHAALFGFAAAAASGGLSAAVDGFAGDPAGPWSEAGLFPWLSAAAGAAAYAVLLRRSAHDSHWGWDLPRTALVLATVAAAGGWVVAVLARALAQAPGGLADGGRLAALRTAVLAAAALALAAGGSWRFREMRWLVYPLLGLGALKVLIEDIPHGRPATLVLSLVVFGGALIAAPMLLRHDAKRSPAEASARL